MAKTIADLVAETLASAGVQRPTRARATRASTPKHQTRLVSELAADHAIFTADVGTPTVWAARYLRMNGRRRLLSGRGDEVLELARTNLRR